MKPTEAGSLALGAIGNCAASALVDGRGRIVWSCWPRFDGDPVFHALLGGDSPEDGCFGIELQDFARPVVLAHRFFHFFLRSFFGRERTITQFAGVGRPIWLEIRPRSRCRCESQCASH